MSEVSRICGTAALGCARFHLRDASLLNIPFEFQSWTRAPKRICLDKIFHVRVKDLLRHHLAEAKANRT